MRNNGGISLVEVLIAITVLFLLVAASTPFYLNYRGRTQVNRAAEVARALIERGGEEAKTSGYPLPEELTRDGLTAAPVAPTRGQTLVVRLRKQVGEKSSLIAERPLPGSERFETNLSGLGLLESEGSQVQGIFVEFLQVVNGIEVVLATIPVDVNGEFVLASEQANGFVQFGYGGHTRTIEITARGVVRSDQR
ncbi:MAG: prepilin-type N-terminal cleavage/methylation domain-containing protein [Vulcanimicrobiota bacterium]